MNKLILASIFTAGSLGLCLSVNAFADDRSDKFFEQTIDATDQAVGHAVKGTGNIIRAASSKLRSHTSSLGDTTTDAE